MLWSIHTTGYVGNRLRIDLDDRRRTLDDSLGHYGRSFGFKGCYQGIVLFVGKFILNMSGILYPIYRSHINPKSDLVSSVVRLGERLPIWKHHTQIPPISGSICMRNRSLVLGEYLNTEVNRPSLCHLIRPLLLRF